MAWSTVSIEKYSSGNISIKATTTFAKKKEKRKRNKRKNTMVTMKIS